MKLSERLAAGCELTPELREEFARMLGWALIERPQVDQFGGRFKSWFSERDEESFYGKTPPKLDLTEIVAEIERRGLDWNFGGTKGYVIAWVEGAAQLERKDRNIQLCAMAALAMAIEGEN